MKHSLRIFLVHGGIFLTYFIATSLKFVYERSPNPVGHGILMLLCILVHIAGGANWIWRHRKKMLKGDVVMHVTALLLPIVLFLVFSNPVSELLWKWRGD